MWLIAHTRGQAIGDAPRTRPFRPSAPSVLKRETRRDAIVLVANDVEEIRDGIEKLLTADGYRVDPARGEDEAVESARRRCPDLVLVSLGGGPEEVVAAAARIRRRAQLSGQVPVVVFCIPTLEEGAEVAVGDNFYVTRPDNFDQLRGLLRRLLHGGATALTH